MAISPVIINLWFDTQAEEAARFYTSIFPNSRLGRIVHYPEAATEISGKPAGSVLTVDFELNGHRFVALNGGPEFKFNESVSLMIECDTQEEIDDLWAKLTDGGEESACGWLKDRFGISWQVTPRRLNELMADPDPKKVNAVAQAFLPMRKLDIATIERAYAEA